MVTEDELDRAFEYWSEESLRIAEEAADAQREAVADEVWGRTSYARQGVATPAGLMLRDALVKLGYHIIMDDDGEGWLAIPPEAVGDERDRVVGGGGA